MNHQYQHLYECRSQWYVRSSDVAFLLSGDCWEFGQNLLLAGVIETWCQTARRRARTVNRLDFEHFEKIL